MRIIGGTYRGKSLDRVLKPTTRETADMVRESVFNMLHPYQYDQVLDLFSGSGAYGLEAISRGSIHADLVDIDKDAILTIKRNVLSMKISDNVSIYHMSYDGFMSKISKTYDLIFLDPPYQLDVYEDLLNKLSPSLSNDGKIVCESDKKRILPDALNGLVKIKDKTYGIKRITIYEKA